MPDHCHPNAIALTAEQQQAMVGIKAFLADRRRRLLVVFGLVGSGKTTLMCSVARQFPRAVDVMSRKARVRAIAFGDPGQLPPVGGGGPFGFALTAQKAQGSEWNRLMLIDDYPPNSLKFPDRTKWLYTGITGAAQSIVVARS
jgi:hypothetical protein